MKRSRDGRLMARLALLEGQALNDLGRPREALARLDVALAADRERAAVDPHALYERAVALFELSRFAESRTELAEVIERNPDDAWAHHHLGLVLERLGDGGGAERELVRARAMAPSDFRDTVLPTTTEFRALVDEEVARLPEPMRRDLRLVSLETADVPDVSDLLAEEPPLSPTILGLYRGAPLPLPAPGDPAVSPRPPCPTCAEEARTIVLYRKNLGRAVASRDDLITQIRTTLLHELGHLRGEDDDALRARGLE